MGDTYLGQVKNKQMTKKDFFIITIKLFGLFALVTSLFSIIPSNITYALMGIDATSILWILFTATMVGGLFVILLFKAEKVVELLKLDNGFDDDRIDLGTINPLDIIKIGTFIIGGILLLNNVPEFLSDTFFWLKGRVVGERNNEETNFNWAVSGINVVVGYLLLTNYDIVARRLNINKHT